ncbi:MAG: sn-glycerol-3-phosphate ABC transporter ATP-binding protein UgpC [Beijerinckiaceae bacterium]|nr:sn-glycerol-3-phosphate ABC transporter ATP-binding protein UgpC [Beijerinckiaceae bacterium]
MASVTLDHLKKIYPGGVEAVKDVSLTVPDGSFTVLLGPSGCGKSTLLRMIAGLEGISSGTATIGERIVNEIEPAERDIAMVFQNYALYPHMSVYDNMAYGLRNRKVPEADIAARVNEAAKILSIESFLKRKPRELSGGQRQRVAMGRAIVRDPQVFLFDEPLSNLDAKLRVQMRLEIRRLHNRLKATSIFVTHDQVEAMTLADQVVVMNAGRVEQVGAPLAIYSRPASRFVAEFIGAPPMNLLRGTITAPGVVSIKDGLRLPFDQSAFDAGIGQTVDYGVRPEDVAITDMPAANGATEPSHSMTVDLIEELGSNRVIYGLLAGSGFALVTRTGIASADRVAFVLDPSSAHLFDGESGMSLRHAV